MSEETKIEWTDSTFNPWIGCGKVSPGCDNCYAEVSTPARTMKVIWAITGDRTRTSVQNWNLPKRWEAKHEEFFAKHGRRQRVFCASLADVFDKAAPFEWRADLWNLIEATPHLEWLLLTKRIGNAFHMLPINWHKKHPGNVRLGISVVNQEEADRDIPKLLALNFPNFLSMEPLLSHVDLGLCNCDKGSQPGPGGAGGVTCSRCNGTGGRKIDWVIVGGESGTKARPMHPDWVRSLRDQCEATETQFLFKQYGEHTHSVPWSHGDPDFYMHADGRCGTEESAIADGGKWQGMYRIGKKAAGRELDGRTWNGYPS